MFLVLAVFIAIAAVYHGINLLLLFKNSLPTLLVSALMALSLLIALPFIPYASIYSASKQIHWGYCITLALLYTLFLAIVVYGFYVAFQHKIH